MRKALALLALVLLTGCVTWELSNGMELRNVRLSPWDYDRVQVVGTREWEEPAL